MADRTAAAGELSLAGLIAIRYREHVGLIRKAISGTAAVATGGLSLGVIQFRSDTERVAYQTKKLRRTIERQGSVASSDEDFHFDGDQSEVRAPRQAPGATGFAGFAPTQNLAIELPTVPPADAKVGWKADPETAGLERFWNGRSWTSKTRNPSV